LNNFSEIFFPKRCYFIFGEKGREVEAKEAKSGKNRDLLKISMDGKIKNKQKKGKRRAKNHPYVEHLMGRLERRGNTVLWTQMWRQAFLESLRVSGSGKCVSMAITH
jgi:hypothetical protein